MTSYERREARYQRRKAKREAKRLRLLETHNFNLVADANSLYEAMLQSRKGVYWKASVQRYCMNALRNVINTSEALKNGDDIRRGFIEFNIVERGKTRYIRSVHFSERVVQKSLCRNLLVPLLTRSLIYDNGASIKDKGIDFAINRLKTHLRRHYKEHGTNGYVVVIDFKSYFANISHDGVYRLLCKTFGEDEAAIKLAVLFVKAFGDKGLGLGSEISQIIAVAYTSLIDHYIKEVLRCKYYGRYMDDSYIICESKERAREVLESLLVKYSELDIIPNPRKTTIVKFTKGFTFLKTQFSVTETGRIIMRPCRASAVYQRRKLKKFKKFLDDKTMTMPQIRTSYTSWQGHMSRKNARRTVNNMDNLYRRLFHEDPITGLIY